MKQAVLNSPLVLGGRRYIRGDTVELADEDYEFYTRRGMCEPSRETPQPKTVTRNAIHSKKRR